MKNILFLVIVVVCLSSCVSSKKFTTLEQDNRNNVQQIAVLNDKINFLESNYNSSQEQNKKLSLSIDSCQQVINDQKAIINNLNVENDKLLKQIDISSQRVKQVLSNKSEQMQELANTLYQREEQLNIKESTLDSLQRQFEHKQTQVQQLKDQLASSQTQLQSIHNKLKDALLGFADNGLSIENKNGKIYVLMEEKLLFASGSWQVSKQGIEALQEIAIVLANNPDIDIIVEGHTDNVPLKGNNQIKDNWDLSVVRATAITKILLESTGISPDRITPCGKGQYMPIAPNDTKEHKAKNRRTEIILSPKVQELMDILK